MAYRAFNNCFDFFRHLGDSGYQDLLSAVHGDDPWHAVNALATGTNFPLFHEGEYPREYLGKLATHIEQTVEAGEIQP